MVMGEGVRRVSLGGVGKDALPSSDVWVLHA